MPYRTKRRGKRSYSRKAAARRRPARASYRSRTSRKSTRRGKPGMSRKRLLNVTSRKKRNTLLTVTNSNNDGTTSATAKLSGTTVNGVDGGIFIFCPTAQDLTTVAGNIGAVSQAAQRTATTCYMRGLSEHLRIQTSSALPWFHRRVCFTVRGTLFTGPATGTPTALYRTYYDDPTRGLTRYFLNSANNNQAAFNASWQALLFKGTYNQDWNDLITAPIDNTRVDLKSDKTYTYKTGNNYGIVKELKAWYPMNRNLVYDDDESGDTETTNYLSVQDKRGMGDYYIIDFIQPGEGAVAGDLMRINATSTLYWHER